ncbi:MAG: hypothetical protein RJA49_2073 [Actinomycetota bacterium]
MKFTDEFLEGLRDAGDPEADDVVDEYMSRVEIDVDGDGLDDLTGRPTTIFRRLLGKAIGSDEHGPTVAAFINRPVPLPDWAEPARIEQAQRFFHEYAPQFALGLWLASIPSGYAGARDAIILGESIRCVSEPRARFFETGQFVADVMKEHSLFSADEPGLAAGIGARDIRHVRLVHGLARYLITHDELTSDDFTWTPAMGRPVNQMALLATMFTFSVVGVESLEKFGIRVRKDDRENYAHLWNVVGHLLGIRPDLLPLDFDQSQAVWERIKEREYASSEQGVLLTNAAIEALRTLIPSKAFHGFPATGMRELIGDATADLLQVPPADWTRKVLRTGSALNSMASRVNQNVPGARSISRWMGKAIFTNFVMLENARQGDREQFEIDDELRKRIVLRTKAERADAMKARVARLTRR